MKRITTEGKGLDDLALIEEALAPPAPGQLRLSMMAMTINPADLLMLEGRYGVRPRRAFTPGAEGVARVADLGPDVEGVSVGDLVIPMAGQAWCDEMNVDARAVIALPPGTDLDQTAMLKANPATALVMLSELRALEPGARVIQNAANSAVGRNVIAIGRELGLEIVNVVRREGAADELRETTGAGEVIVGPPGPEVAPCALALDAVGGAATAALAARLEDGGTVATYGVLSGEDCRVAAHDLVFRGVTLCGFWLAEWFKTSSPAHVAATYARLVDWLEAGVIGAPVAARYPLEQAREAVAHAAREARSGKVLLTTHHMG